MLKIVLGIVATWLVGSIIYSTQLHLRNYFKSRGNDTLMAKDLEFNGQEIQMVKSAFLRKTISFQIIKLCIVIIILIYIFNKG